MKLEGSFEVPSPPENVWKLLTDPSKLSRALPDLRKFEPRDAGSFYAEFRLKVGLLSGNIGMLFRYTDLRAPSHISVTGHGTGMQSTVDLRIDLDLIEQEKGKSLVKWAADVSVGGVAASLGARIMEDLAKSKVRELVANLKKVASTR